MNTNKILNISSDYNIKIIFSYLDYNSMAQIIKYNKCLKNKLNIKIENNYVIKEKINDNKYLEKISNLNKLSIDISFYLFSYFYVIYSVIFILNEFFSFSKFVIIIIEILYFIFIDSLQGKIHSFIRFVIPLFISIFRGKYFYLKYIFVVSLRILFPFIVQKLLLPKENEYVSKLKIKINIIFSIIIYCLSFFYDCFIRKIAINDFNLIITIIFTIYIFISYMIIFLFYIYYYNYLKNINFFIIEYENIKIKDYCLENFEKEKDKGKFIKKIYKNFQIERSREERELAIKINKFRAQNKLNKLWVYKRIPDFIINKPCEIILFPYKKFYRIYNDQYIFKINIKDTNILDDTRLKNILLKNDLDRIYFIKQNDFIYISPFFN